MSVKFRHLLLLFYKIPIPIYAFLPAMQNLKNVSAVEVRSSSSQPASHGFLDCLVSLVVVTSQVILQGSEQVAIRGGQIRTVGWIGEQFPAVLCTSVPVSSKSAMSVFPPIKCFIHLLTLLVPMQESPYTPRSRS
jgi:hypothetical protein